MPQLELDWVEAVILCSSLWLLFCMTNEVWVMLIYTGLLDVVLGKISLTFG